MVIIRYVECLISSHLSQRLWRSCLSLENYPCFHFIRRSIHTDTDSPGPPRLSSPPTTAKRSMSNRPRRMSLPSKQTRDKRDHTNINTNMHNPSKRIRIRHPHCIPLHVIQRLDNRRSRLDHADLLRRQQPGKVAARLHAEESVCGGDADAAAEDTDLRDDALGDG